MEIPGTILCIITHYYYCTTVLVYIYKYVLQSAPIDWPAYTGLRAHQIYMISSNPGLLCVDKTCVLLSCKVIMYCTCARNKPSQWFNQTATAWGYLHLL